MKKKYYIFLFLFSFFVSSLFHLLIAQNTSAIEFNSSSDLNNFYTDGNQSNGGEILPRYETSGGLFNSGYLRVNDNNSSKDIDEVFISKQGYSNSGVGSVYKFSIYFKSNGVGYGGLGFQIPESNGTLNTTAQGLYARSNGKVLGISFHGGGYIWHNGTTNSPSNWQPINGSSGLTQHFDKNGNGTIEEEEKWLFAELTIENLSESNFKLSFKSYKSNVDGELHGINTSESITYANANFQDANILHSYFAVGGNRISHLDRYSVNLSGGSSFIEAGLPIVTGNASRSGTTINLNGEVTDDRGSTVIERGFVWSQTNENPTISDTKIIEGTGEGVFTGTISNINGGVYYLRSFAKNSEGTSYGQTTEIIVESNGNLKVVTSGGSERGTTWDLISGFIVSRSSEEASINASVINAALNVGDLTLLTNGYINMESDITWNTDSNLTLKSAGNILFNSQILATNDDAGLNIYYGGSDDTTVPSNSFDYIFNLSNEASIKMTGTNASVNIANNSYNIVNDISELSSIPSSSSDRVVLTDDIDLSVNNYSTAVISSVFEGVFEGFGNEIQNMNIRNSGGSLINLGFFSEVRGATIRNLGVTDMDIFTSSTSNSTEYRVGGIVGNIGQADLSSGYSKEAYTTTLNGLWSTGKIATANTDPTVTASDTDKQAIFFAGGLVGNVNNGTTFITRSYSSADVSSAGSEISRRLSVGGLVGDVGNYDKTNSSTTVKFVLERSYSTGSILTAHHSSGYYGTGGLVGVIYVSDSSISNCYSWSNVVSQDVSYGGIAGYQNSLATSVNSYTTLTKKGNGSFPTSVYSNVTETSPVSGTNIPGGFNNIYWSKQEGKLPSLKELTYPRTALYVKVNNGIGPVGNIFPTYTILNESGNEIDLVSLGLSAPTGTALYTIDNNTPAGTYNDVAYLGGLTLNGVNSALYTLKPYSVFGTYEINANAPNITSFSPTSVEIGSEINIIGVNFNLVNTVTIGGVDAIFTLNSDTSITVIVPQEAKSGAITVTTSSNGQSSKSGFILLVPINNITINEGSDWGVFTVNGPVGDVFSLKLLQESGEADLGNPPTIQSWNGSAWIDYNPDDQLTVPSGGSVNVRVDITNEKDTVFEGVETFSLEVIEIPNDLVGLTVYDANFQTFNLDNYNRTGTDGAVGTTYKKVNAITINGQAIDVVIRIDDKSNVSSFTFDSNTNPSRFEPRINSNSSSGSFVDFTFEFFLSGTTTKVGVKNFVIHPVDIDGSASSKEFVELFGLSSYQLGQTSGLTVIENPSGRTGFTRFEGINTSLSGIDFEETASFIAYYEKPVDKFKIRMGVTGSSSDTRLFSSSIGSAIGTFAQPANNNITTILGIATIKDDGTGNYWVGDNLLPATSSELVNANITLDDDQVKDINASGITVASISDLVYSGFAQTPSPEVKDGTTVLLKDTDYELSYVNNTNVGTATITITGKGNYNGTRTVTFNITKAFLTVTADSGQTKVYGAIDPALNYTITGFVNSDTESSLDTGVSIARATGEDVNTYTITPSGAVDSNYDIGFVTADFSITKASLTVTADSGQIKVYGATDPALNYTITGFVNSDTESSLDTGVSIVRATGEDVDTYTITPSGAVDSNYNISFVTADFSITKAALTVTADSGQTKVYGATDPALNYTITG
ncbi:MBG domain-containing protein, partial [uncultured Polaribacter sp.]|uniref:MBG domain-containing protein n=1 Tax=uncultured Polaribacter sp. TaxID=174711 RepID=UPI002603B205